LTAAVACISLLRQTDIRRSSFSHIGFPSLSLLAGARRRTGTSACAHRFEPDGSFGQGERMSKVVYEIVEHDGGWAYRVGDTYSETFRTREAAHMAACRAALEQQVPGQSAAISWEDERGHWHAQIANGDDRPDTDVEG
jgi:Uncharacterized protein conserved in bacteria (DUF2188)